MSAVSDAIDQLYSHFLLRDVLAKAVPGFLTLALLLVLFFSRQQRWMPIDVGPSWVEAIVTYGVSFLVGIVLQFLAQSIRLIQVHVWPPEEGMTAAHTSIRKARQFINANQSNPDILRVRERFVILKEMTGSYAAFAAVGAVLLLISPLTTHIRPDVQWFTAVVVIGLIALALAKQNRYHALEQRTWEEEATERSTGQVPPRAAARQAHTRRPAARRG